MVSKGKEAGGIVKGNEGQIYGEERRLAFGLWAHNSIYRPCVINVYQKPI